MKSFKFVLTFVAVVTLSLPVSLIQAKPAKAQAAPNYSNVLSFDKSTVKGGDEFQLSIVVKNNGTAINNFEVRVPFYKSINDAVMVTESPAFNQILNSADYPTGYNSHSWIINSFDAGETKTFFVKYKMNADPMTPNGLVSNITIPASWSDPEGLQSGSPLSLATFRADVYIANSYSTSSKVALPKLAALDNPVSSVKLNAAYYFAGSKSTNLKEITAENIKAFPNFKLETEDVLIEWTNPVDFSGSDIVASLTNLDQILKVQWGKVEVNGEQVGFLNKPLKVTFKNLNFVFEPKLRVKTIVGTLAEGKGVWSKELKTATVNSDTLNTLAIAPNIVSDQNIIETTETRITIKGKTADPRSSISYDVDKTGTKEILGVDLQNGEFEFSLENADKITQIEISSRFKNNETDTKIVAVSFKTKIAPVVATSTDQPKTVTLLFNPITKILLLLALAMLSVICGFIYYLFYKKKKLKKLESSKSNSDPLGPITADAVNSLTSPDIFKPKSQETSKPENQKALENEYLLKPEIKDPKVEVIPLEKKDDTFLGDD